MAIFTQIHAASGNPNGLVDELLKHYASVSRDFALGTAVSQAREAGLKLPTSGVLEPTDSISFAIGGKDKSNTGPALPQ